MHCYVFLIRPHFKKTVYHNTTSRFVMDSSDSSSTDENDLPNHLPSRKRLFFFTNDLLGDLRNIILNNGDLNRPVPLLKLNGSERLLRVNKRVCTYLLLHSMKYNCNTHEYTNNTFII